MWTLHNITCAPSSEGETGAGGEGRGDESADDHGAAHDAGGGRRDACDVCIASVCVHTIGQFAQLPDGLLSANDPIEIQGTKGLHHRIVVLQRLSKIDNQLTSLLWILGRQLCGTGSMLVGDLLQSR